MLFTHFTFYIVTNLVPLGQFFHFTTQIILNFNTRIRIPHYLNDCFMDEYVKVGRKNSQQASTTSPVATEQIFERGNITIGEALEATALTAGSRPVDYSDAAAIQAAEVRATGRTNIVPGGVAAAAQSAATRNARITREDDKTKLSEILAVSI